MNRWWPYIFATIVIICTPTVALVMFAAVRSEPASTSPPIECTDEATRERVRQLMLDALDEALKERIKHLFDIWMRDDTNQPARAAHGTRLAIRAYDHARGQTLRWHPPEC